MFQRREPFRAVAGCLEGMLTDPCKFSTRAASLNWVQYPPRRDEGKGVYLLVSLSLVSHLIDTRRVNLFSCTPDCIVHSLHGLPTWDTRSHTLWHPTLEVMGGHKLWATGPLAQLQEQTAR